MGSLFALFEQRQLVKDYYEQGPGQEERHEKEAAEIIERETC